MAAITSTMVALVNHGIKRRRCFSLWLATAATGPESLNQLGERNPSSVISSAPFAISPHNAASYISASQKKILLREFSTTLRTLTHYVVIAGTQWDIDTQQFAQDLGDVFNKAGINPLYDYTRPDNPDQTGIIICIKDINNPPREAEILENSFREANIDFKVRKFPEHGFTGDKANPNLVIWVAPAPL
ncbi:MAG TPA: hypothetical protein VJ770_11590 [Stellaceae bacterium]|nr:hypothetical protein [Stellaceae bacterium]